MRGRAMALAAVVMMTPLGARAADLVVWWQTDLHVQEDEAVAQIIDAFEQETGKEVELVQPAQGEIVPKVEAALRAARGATRRLL